MVESTVAAGKVALFRPSLAGAVELQAHWLQTPGKKTVNFYSVFMLRFLERAQ